MAVRRSVLMILKSPRFLFREVDDAAASSNTAARLAFALTDAPPDEPLQAAARRGNWPRPINSASKPSGCWPIPARSGSCGSFYSRGCNSKARSISTKTARSIPTSTSRQSPICGLRSISYSRMWFGRKGPTIASCSSRTRCS